MKPDNYILVDNLASALHLAIETLKKQEAAYDPEFHSILRAGLESNLAALQAGQELEINYKRD